MSTKRSDLYAVLGVPPSATQAEISRAYRALLRRHHPDTRPQDDESQRIASDATLHQVLAAYAVLHDPDRRRDYDRGAERQAAPTRHRPQQQVFNDAHRQQSIIAGPVRWHRSH
jgi:curved DNA-binding protein CbpA